MPILRTINIDIRTGEQISTYDEETDEMPNYSLMGQVFVDIAKEKLAADAKQKENAFANAKGA